MIYSVFFGIDDLMRDRMWAVVNKKGCLAGILFLFTLQKLMLLRFLRG